MHDHLVKFSFQGGKRSENLALDPRPITRDQYLADRSGKTFGTANPTIMDKPFWKYMIGKGGERGGEIEGSAFFARQLFDDVDLKAYSGHGRDTEDLCEESDPVWCFRRMGRTGTTLPDGRHVLIGGEHEDFYDPDFCIYNDVLSGPPSSDSSTSSAAEGDIPRCYTGPANFHDAYPQPPSPECITIYGYPVDVFPPTDFHTSTYFRDPKSGKEFIFIIGGLGYMGSASRDRTDVYRLDLSDFSIKKMETSGSKPARGIDDHTAKLIDDEDGGSGAEIMITTKVGQVFSLVIDRLEWISHG
ncbi:unnamed protein product [Calypogeia fissa]